MISGTYSAYTASLFGIEARPVAVSFAKAAAQAQVVVPRQVGAAPLADASAAYGAPDVYKDPEFMRDPAAALAKAEAWAEAYEAREQRFEQENGFRRKVNSGALGSYAKAQSGNFGVPAFAKAKDAMEYLVYIASSIGSNAMTVKHLTFEDKSYDKPEVAAFYGEVATRQTRAKYADHIKAAEMDIFVLSAVLKKTFGVEGPITRAVDGAIRFVAQDFSVNGRAFARITEAGDLLTLGPDGEPVGEVRPLV